MSISNLVKSANNLRLLDSPWNSDEINMSQATLKKAKNLVDAWERKYGRQHLVRHHSPAQVPTIITFEMLDDDVIFPMETLGG